MEKKKILLIDDEPHVTSVISHFLIRSGYDVDSANNGLMALEKVSKRMPDVIVSDIQMPKLTGLEFCERFRADYAGNESLIIIMTSRTERDFREQVGSLENVEFFEKPLSPRKLIARLKEYFEEMECVV